MLLTLVINFTGVRVCVDYCKDQIAAIHFGEDEDSCDMDGCDMTRSSSCCDSKPVQIDQQLLDFTLTDSEVNISQPFVLLAFASYLNLFSNTDINPTTKIRFPARHSIPISSFDVRDLTQISLC
jgi:hypothetical protein